jgi:hypothetical protein
MNLYAVLLLCCWTILTNGASLPRLYRNHYDLDQNSRAVARLLPAVAKRHVDVGIFADRTTIAAREQTYGFHYQHLLIFQPVTQLDYAEIQTINKSGHDVILNMEFPTNLFDILNGDFDPQLTLFAQEITAGRHNITIRTLHEQNGDWYNWGLLVGGSYEAVNTLEDYNKAWKRIIDLFTAQGADKYVSWQLDINCSNGLDNTQPLADFYPFDVDEYFSTVSITCYNRAFLYPKHFYSLSFYDAFKDAYDQVRNFTDKPLAIAETATLTQANGHTVDKVTWLTEAWRSIAVDFPSVVQVTWFFFNKVEEGVNLTWDLDNQTQIDAYSNGYRTMLNFTKG